MLSESFLDVPGSHHVAYVAHGSELRQPDLHMERYEHSYFKSAPEDWVNRLRDLAARNAVIAAGERTFVTTPDLLLDAPTATWLPLVVELATWRTRRPLLESDIPVVLHAPSRSTPPIKGSDTIDRVLNHLSAKGAVRYLRAEGVPHTRMPALVATADIVIDQILTGSYGVAAIEAMAAGRVVIGNVLPDVRSLMPEPPPIVDATPDDLEAVLASVLGEPDECRRLGYLGREFADRWHDGQAAVRALKEFLGYRGSTSPGDAR